MMWSMTYISRRVTFRAEYLRLAQEAYQRSELILAEEAGVSNAIVSLFSQFDQRIRHYELMLKDER
jgi:hypothetical protein